MNDIAPSNLKGGAVNPDDSPVTAPLALVFWAIVAALLVVQILGLSAFFRHHGIFYNTFHEFPIMAVRIAGNIIAVLILRFVFHRWFRQSNTWWRLQGWKNLAIMTVEMAGIVLVLTLTSYAYSWPKVMLPMLNPRLWDVLFARIDTVLCVGVNPNEFFLTVFEGAPRFVSRLLDRYYGLFVISQSAVSAWFITDPRFKERVVFGTSTITLWLLGTWGYVVMPALGPVYAFEGYLQRIAAIFPTNAATQAALFTNYDAVHRLLAGEDAMIVPHLGIAAMPSLHVAVHFFLFLWARRIGSRLSPLLLGMTMLTFIGSMATGWHYLIDGLIGLVLAAAVFGAGLLFSRFIGTISVFSPQKPAESCRPGAFCSRPDN